MIKNLFPEKKIEEVCEFQNGLWTGKKPPFKKMVVLRNTNFKNGDGTINFDDVAEIEVEEKQLNQRLLNKGDIILERSGGGPDQPVGRVVLFEGENNKYSFSNFTTRIRVNDNDADSRYVWRYLDYFYRTGRTEPMQQKTTGIRNLTFSEYKAIKIPLPPLPEQKKIVKKIEGLFRKINEAQKLRQEAQVDAAALIPAALHQIFEKGKKEGWKEVELIRTLELCDSGTWGEENEKGLPLLRSTNMQNGELVLSDLKVIKVPADKVDRYTLREGDILITKSSGSVKHIGKSLYITQEMDGKYGFSNFTQRIRANKDIVDPKWIYYIISNPSFRDTLLNASQTTTGLRNLKIPELKKFKILLPPLSEQKKIVAYLDSLSEKAKKLQELQKQTAEDMKALKQSILHRAFKGELIK